MLSLGMAFVVIGRGLDLTMIATLAAGLCWALFITANGVPFGLSLVMGAALVVLFGTVIGVIVAFAEIPAIFTTLAMASVIFGVGNTFLFSSDTFNAPNNVGWLQFLGYGSFLGVPIVIYALAALALLVHAVLRWTRFGRFVYAIGDNPLAARLTGVPVRPIIVFQYVATALIAYLSGLVIVASNSGINSRIYNSTLIYDVLLVVVLGGIGLSGGRGGVRNVLVGTLLVGTLVSGMTILNLPYATQNLIKSLVLLAALVADTLINPRDEQTSQQGDI
jgi:ribose transport system permease protein